MSLACYRHIYCCLLALMFIIVRTADAHAHLCQDGNEPPVTIHLGDGGTHPCDTGAEGGHTEDTDVSIAADVVLKKPPSADPWITATIALLFEIVASGGEPRLFAATPDFHVQAEYFLRPPLRGPPA